MKRRKHSGRIKKQLETKQYVSTTTKCCIEKEGMERNCLRKLLSNNLGGLVLQKIKYRHAHKHTHLRQKPIPTNHTCLDSILLLLINTHYCCPFISLLLNHFVYFFTFVCIVFSPCLFLYLTLFVCLFV